MEEDRTEDENCYSTKREKKIIGQIEYPVIDMKRTGQNLKRICEERRISVMELQSFLGLSCPQTVYHWFSGQAVPSVDNLFALANLLEVPMEKILVKRLFAGKNSFYFLMTEQPWMKGWEFIMRMMNYQSKNRVIMQQEIR